MDHQHVPPGIEVAPSNGLNVFYDGSNQKYPVEPQASQGFTPSRPELRESKRVCGCHRSTFLLLAALAAALVVVIAVAALAGVETSKHRNDQKGSNPTASAIAQPISSTADSTSASAPSSSATESSPTSSSTSASQTATSNSMTPPLGSPALRDCLASNGTTFNPTTPYDSATTYMKFCNADMVATNKTDLASFVVNSFDLCIQTCAGQRSRMPVFAVYHWKDGTEERTDRQRPGSCWCEDGIDANTVAADNIDTAIPRST